ncbi:hypothetical protein [Tissierella sp. Yu-01]|uniref:hypothetical protein n=1 Tax=Tissierella sp. Yu-01 TaxID=3035694 RepID=UPI00240E15D8|nr:hypothetical protein [Tissierella sp. Yu-01]WFA09042.1 hypothetical protein P3962_00300 [Tissierella sp. Yu-01]
MSKDIKCLRCGNVMKHIRDDKLQLGQTGWFLGDLSNLLSGALPVEIYLCQECMKLEFFSKKLEFEVEYPEDPNAQIICPRCRKLHDKTYDECPFCEYDYYSKSKYK